ncbi:MAG TPA: YfhO family protein [Bryobacteraceae bacterium]|jgi:hypothetical protein|nr:YfhO family protein [Bryobacteraceae bacterium]
MSEPPVTRTTVKYLALLALAITLFFWKTLLTSQFTVLAGSEAINQSYGWLHFWVYSIRHFHLPLWDPYAFSGRPFAGEMDPAAYYPLNLLFALVPPNRTGLISPHFYSEFLAFTHVLCAWFMFALLRELRCSRFAAFVGACAFSLGGLLSRMIWLQYVESCIWLPLIFLFLLRAFRAETRGRALLEAVLSGSCLGLSILTGGLTFALMQGIFALTAVLYYGARKDPARPFDRQEQWIKIAAIFGVFLCAAGGAGAIQLLCSQEYGQLSMRFIDGGAFPAAEKIPYNRLVPGMWPQSIVSALFPTAFDGKFGGEEYFPFYIGVLPFFLALAGIWRCWGQLWVRYLSGLAVVAFAYSLGEFSPLNGVLYAIVPLLWTTRSANRFLYLVSFALAILAALGLDVLLENAGKEWWTPAKGILKWIAIACGLALFVPGVFTQLTLGIWTAFSLLLVLGACACFAWLIRQPAGPWLRVILAVFVLFDLSAFEWRELNRSHPSKPDAELDQMLSLRGPSEFIKSQPGLHRVRVGVSPEPNVGDVYRIQSTWGGGPSVLNNYSKLGIREDLLNVGFLIRPASTPDPNPVYQDGRWKVYANPRSFPRGWLVHKTVVDTAPDGVFRRLDDPAINLHETALLDAPLPPDLARGLDGVAGLAESVQFRSYEANRLAVDVTSEKPGLLVLSEMFYPGWHATVNGKPADIYKVDGALRGILTPQGASRIELSYAPFSIYAGAAITGLTFLAVLAGVFLNWRKPLGADKSAGVI